jgi:hypothetical protein
MSRELVLAGNFPTKDEDLLVFGRGVQTDLTGSTQFNNAPVPPAALGKLLDSFEALIGKKGPGVASNRKAARVKVEIALRQNLAYVEGIAATLAPEDIDPAIQGAGFSRKKPTTYHKPPYAVDPGKVQGDALISLRALGRHGTIMYCHQYSVDKGATWVDEPPTTETSLTIHGLPVLTEIRFRFRTLKKGVYGNWSQMLTLTIP